MLVHYHMNFENALSPDHDQTGWSSCFKAMHLFQGYEVYWQKMYTTISITPTYPNKSMNNENNIYLPQQCQNSMAIYWRQKNLKQSVAPMNAQQLQNQSRLTIMIDNSNFFGLTYCLTLNAAIILLLVYCQRNLKNNIIPD